MSSELLLECVLIGVCLYTKKKNIFENPDVAWLHEVIKLLGNSSSRKFLTHAELKKKNSEKKIRKIYFLYFTLIYTLNYYHYYYQIFLVSRKILDKKKLKLREKWKNYSDKKNKKLKNNWKLKKKNIWISLDCSTCTHRYPICSCHNFLRYRSGKKNIF